MAVSSLWIVDVIYVNKTLVFGSKSLMVSLGKYKYMVSPISFFQVNSYNTINLYNEYPLIMQKRSANENIIKHEIIRLLI